MRNYTFGQSSLHRLEGVKPDLRKLCIAALRISHIDFGIVCGLRSKDEQLMLVNLGRSQTMDSKHLTGDAIDFAPYWGGRYRESAAFYYPVVNAFMEASCNTGIGFRWGSAWTEDMGRHAHAQSAQQAYIEARAAQGTVFIDMPHIELAEATLAV